MGSALTLVVPLVGVILFVFALTRIITGLRFRMVADLHKKSSGPWTSPTLPYSIPGLGSTLSFANTNTGRFWTWLLEQSRRRGLRAVALQLSGTKTHIFFTPDTIIAESRSKQLTRFRLDRQLARNALGMSEEDATKAYPDPRIHCASKLSTHGIHAEHLLTSTAVNKLTSKFMESLHGSFRKDKQADSEDQQSNLCAWTSLRMMEASTISLCGSELLSMHPDLSDDFWLWDENLLALLFGTPRMFAREAYEARDRLLDKLEQWLVSGYERTAGMQDDPDWEPYFGSKLMRERHKYYNQQGMSLRAQAGNDLIFLAGILSNAIPATGWLLLHILSPESPSDLLPKVMEELKSAQQADGSLSASTLTRLPLLNSALNEVLRKYVDFIMVRQVESDTALDGIQVQRGEQVMGSTWMSHRTEEHFARPEDFLAARFIVSNSETGQPGCSVEGLSGKFFPFGDGPYKCPGRVFARQEILAAVGITLLTFDITFVEFIGAKKTGVKGSSRFSAFPTIRKSYPGNVVVGIDGDMRVRIRRRWPVRS